MTHTLRIQPTTRATITDQYGPLIAEKFGGKTAFADEKTADLATQKSPDESKAGVGQYL